MCNWNTMKNMVSDSSLFTDWVNPLNGNERMSAIEAIEKNKMSLYLGNYAGGRKINALSCLSAIYDELEMQEPDYSFVEDTIELLKVYL